MPGVFLAQEHFLFRDAPVDAEALVQDGDAAVGLGMVELVALVLEDGGLAQYGEAVRKSFVDEELEVVVLTQFHGYVLPECGRTFADIDSHVQHATFDAAHQFGLCERRALIVQTAHHAVGGHTLVVLHEADLAADKGCEFLVELTLRETLKEIASRVVEHARFNNKQAVYMGGLNGHTI